LHEAIPYFEEIRNEPSLYQLDINEKGAIKPSLKNISFIPKNGPQLTGVIVYDDFREELLIKADNSWCECKNYINGDSRRNENDAQFKKILEVSHGLSPQIAKFSDPFP
jgi:hypothetical protein